MVCCRSQGVLTREELSFLFLKVLGCYCLVSSLQLILLELDKIQVLIIPYLVTFREGSDIPQGLFPKDKNVKLGASFLQECLQLICLHNYFPIPHLFPDLLHYLIMVKDAVLVLTGFQTQQVIYKVDAHLFIGHKDGSIVVFLHY